MSRRPALALAVVAGTGVLALPALAATRSVTVADNLFAPRSLTVKRGTTVTWVWRGKAPHNVSIKSGPVHFHSPTKTSGRYSKRLKRRGTYRIYCAVHGSAQSMRVTVR